MPAKQSTAGKILPKWPFVTSSVDGGADFRKSFGESTELVSKAESSHSLQVEL